MGWGTTSSISIYFPKPKAPSETTFSTSWKNYSGNLSLSQIANLLFKIGKKFVADQSKSKNWLTMRQKLMVKMERRTSVRNRYLAAYVFKTVDLLLSDLMKYHGHWIYFFRTYLLNGSFSISSNAFCRGYPWSNNIKQIPTDNFVTAYSKYEYFFLSSITYPYLTPFLIKRAAWLSIRCFRQMARGVFPWESSTS